MSRIRAVQPVQRIYLYTIYPYLPMQVRPCDSPGLPDLADQLSGLDLLTGGHVDLCLVVIGSVDPPAVVNKNGVAAYFQGTCKDDSTGRSCIDVEGMFYKAHAVVYARVEVDIITAVERSTSPEPVVNAGLLRSEEHTSELQSPTNLVCRL